MGMLVPRVGLDLLEISSLRDSTRILDGVSRERTTNKVSTFWHLYSCLPQFDMRINQLIGTSVEDQGYSLPDAEAKSVV